MTDETRKILNIVALKFCNGCSWLNPLWMELAPEGCCNNSCPYKETYCALKKRLDMAEKQAEAFLMEGTKE